MGGRNLREIEPPAGVPARYSERGFPPYRHVPGLHPHPVAHPDGHSHHLGGEHPEAGPLLPPPQWAACEDYLYGVDLYNHGYWWEAHEAWEGLWQQTDKRELQGRFLQGLIQVSAAHLQRHVGHAEGVARLLERALFHLAAVAAAVPPGARYMGVDVHGFLDHVTSYFAGTTTRFPALVLGRQR